MTYKIHGISVAKQIGKDSDAIVRFQHALDDLCHARPLGFR